jgi:hypothetical protein
LVKQKWTEEIDGDWVLKLRDFFIKLQKDTDTKKIH